MVTLMLCPPYIGLTVIYEQPSGEEMSMVEIGDMRKELQQCQQAFAKWPQSSNLHPNKIQP